MSSVINNGINKGRGPVTLTLDARFVPEPPTASWSPYSEVLLAGMNNPLQLLS